MSHFKIILLLIVVAGLLYLPIHFFILSADQPIQPVKVNQSPVQIVEPAQSEVPVNSGAVVPTSNSPTTTDNSFLDSNLNPTEFTPETYQQIKYDPFKNTPEDFDETILQTDSPNTIPQGKITVTTNISGLADKNSGTVETEFKFSALGADNETSSRGLQYRWDFESDGTPDTYFSKTATARHKYEKAGVYTVTLEILDTGGAVGKVQQQIKVVENTPPIAMLLVEPYAGTTGKIFVFNTADSMDSQFVKNSLEYRFDWEGDGKWDTEYKDKTTWRHKFGTLETVGTTSGDYTVSNGGAGTYNVIAEVRDPLGLTDSDSVKITVINNSPPTASFDYEIKENTYGSTKTSVYYFDASASFDPQSYQKLEYRWDFNYTGVNDISFDTGWTINSKYSGTFKFEGSRVVRLQVRDEDGATNEAFLEIHVQ